MFYRSIAETARRLGTSNDVIRRHIRALDKDGILTCVDEKDFNGGRVRVYRVEIGATLATIYTLCMHIFGNARFGLEAFIRRILSGLEPL